MVLNLFVYDFFVPSLSFLLIALRASSVSSVFYLFFCFYEILFLEYNFDISFI